MGLNDADYRAGALLFAGLAAVGFPFLVLLDDSTDKSIAGAIMLAVAVVYGVYGLSKTAGPDLGQLLIGLIPVCVVSAIVLIVWVFAAPSGDAWAVVFALFTFPVAILLFDVLVVFGVRGFQGVLRSVRH